VRVGTAEKLGVSVGTAEKRRVRAGAAEKLGVRVGTAEKGGVSVGAAEKRRVSGDTAEKRRARGDTAEKDCVSRRYWLDGRLVGISATPMIGGTLERASGLCKEHVVEGGGVHAQVRYRDALGVKRPHDLREITDTL
jgi:hypothetical protein